MTKIIQKTYIIILLQGESGTGKEELALEIHRLSKRQGPFMAINCANLTETLLESELFGHVKGAFTGAINNKVGLFEAANKGTILLDEIAELPFTLQAKLLRVIEERRLRPLGSNVDKLIDIRIITATWKDLKKEIIDKTFREDLFYRVQEATLYIPPLYERPDDIKLLTNYFFNIFFQEFKISQRPLSKPALNKILSYGWPGNIRELKNVCRTAVILSNSKEVMEEDIRLPITINKEKKNSKALELLKDGPENELQFKIPFSKGQTLKDLRKDYEKTIIQTLINKSGQTQDNVARELGISVRTLQRALL